MHLGFGNSNFRSNGGSIEIEKEGITLDVIFQSSKKQIMTLKEVLRHTGTNPECLHWLESGTEKEVWAECERGDWMLSLLEDSDVRTLIKGKVACAKLVEHLMTDKRSLEALKVGERFGDGEATVQELVTAYDAAVIVANKDYNNYPAAIAAYASYIVDENTWVADNRPIGRFESASFTALYVADVIVMSDNTYISPDAAKKEVLKKCADLIREVIPTI